MSIFDDTPTLPGRLFQAQAALSRLAGVYDAHATTVATYIGLVTMQDQTAADYLEDATAIGRELQRIRDELAGLRREVTR